MTGTGYRAAAVRYAKLALGLPVSFGTPPSTEQHSPRDPVRETREQLRTAFLFAHERGQVQIAVSLLEQGIPVQKLQAILASMTSQSRRFGLAARLDAYQATLIDGPVPVAGPNIAATAMISAYKMAVGPDR